MRFKNEIDLARNFEDLEGSIAIFKNFTHFGVYSKYITDRVREIRRLEIKPGRDLADSPLMDEELDLERIGPVFELTFLYANDRLTFPLPIHFYMEHFKSVDAIRIGSGKRPRTFRHGGHELSVGYGPQLLQDSQVFTDLARRLPFFRKWIQERAGISPRYQKRELVL